MTQPIAREITGTITSLQISGFGGSSSSELVITIEPTTGGLESVVMESDAATQMFSAAASMLTAAYHSKSAVTLVIPAGQPAGSSPKISGVLVPSKP